MTNQCLHRLGDGRLCGSPRQANKNYCYYHTRVHESFVLPGNRHYTPPPLTDLHHISIALTHVWSALAKSMITHKQACAMAYQIQLAKQTVTDIMKMEKELQESTKLEGAQSLPSVGKGGMLNADTTTEPQVTGDSAPGDVILSEDARPSEGPLNSSPDPERFEISDTEPPIQEDPIPFDPDHPPLCMERALRPFNPAPKESQISS